MTDNEKMMTEITGIVEKQRELAETVGTNSAEYKRYLENADAKMSEFEKQNTEANQKYAESLAVTEELKERVKDLEGLASLGASAGTSGEEMKQDANDVMNALLKNRWTGFIADPVNEQKAARVISSLKRSTFNEVNDASKMASFVGQYDEKATGTLRTDIGEYGGFLCPSEFSTELNRNMIEMAPLRSFARVKRTSAKTYEEAIRIGIPVATRVGEGRAGGDSVPNYGKETWSPSRMTNTSAITWDALNDSAFDLVSELMSDNAEAFGVLEGQEFFNGAGGEAGLGWSVDPNVPEFTTAASGVADFDDFIGITGELKRGYNPMFMMNRKSLAGLRLLKDSGGRYLWNPAFGDAASGAPATINGYRYSADFIEFDNLDAGAGKFPVLFADMFRFYQIVDRTDMTIIRDEVTQKRKGLVEYTWARWSIGKPKIKEAGIRMKVKA